MTAPAFYPHRPERVEVRQTHISWVFLAGARVYKVKKPVVMAFLDYSTLEARRFFAEEEVRLNRRLAPTVYEGVVPIRRTASGYGLEGDGEVVDVAVVMRRLPADRMLDRLLASGQAGRSEIVRIAERMVSFHRGVAAVRDPEIGSPEAIAEIATANLDEVERFRGRTVSDRRLDALRTYGRELVTARADTLDARFLEGRIRDGHGDLRAEHVCMEESGEISIFDCVEFSARLRGSDVASEMAFLAMELDFLDAPDLAETLLQTYADHAGDPGMAAVERYHRWYRACVRGKVESYTSDGADVPPLEQRIAEERARRFFALASRYAGPVVPPALVVVAGQIASGKSTLARSLADRTAFALRSSDRTRKGLAGLAPTARATGAAHERLYSAELTERTYEALFAAAERELAAGRGAILDATFAERRWRERALDVAARLRRPCFYVECRADEATTLARLAERAQRDDEPSDATAEIYRERRDSFEPSHEVPAANALRVDTSAGPLGPLDAVEERLLGGDV